LRGDDLTRLNSLSRVPALALTLATTLAFAGCGGNPFKPPPDTGNGGLPVDTPANDSPQNTMTRFQRTYEYQVQPEYVKLLTNDFRYSFSLDSDPALVTLYGPNWGKDDEAESATHLFNGFTSSADGKYYAGATNITMVLNSSQYFDDPAHSDSSAYYQWVTVARVVMSIEVPGDASGPLTYYIDAPHNFYLVRGDALGASLDADQPATSTHWYIRKWDDLSPPPAAGTIRIASVNNRPVGSSLSVPITLGALKASYR